MADVAFWTDADRTDHASRYRNYVRLSEGQFADCWDWPETAPANFAATAWRVANGPVMSPGYVIWHPRILAADLVREDWDGKLVARVDLVTPAPEALRQSSQWGRSRKG